MGSDLSSAISFTSYSTSLNACKLWIIRNLFHKVAVRIKYDNVHRVLNTGSVTNEELYYHYYAHLEGYVPYSAPLPVSFSSSHQKICKHTCSWAAQHTHWQTKPLWGSQDAWAHSWRIATSIIIQLFIHACMHAPIHLHICSSIHLPIHPSICPSSHPSIHLSISSMHLSIHPSIHLSIYLLILL